jgi:hypothetical protein
MIVVSLPQEANSWDLMAEMQRNLDAEHWTKWRREVEGQEANFEYLNITAKQYGVTFLPTDSGRVISDAMREFDAAMFRSRSPARIDRHIWQLRKDSFELLLYLFLVEPNKHKLLEEWERTCNRLADVLSGVLLFSTKRADDLFGISRSVMLRVDEPIKVYVDMKEKQHNG